MRIRYRRLRRSIRNNFTGRIEKVLTPDVVYSALAQIGGGSKTLLASSCTSGPKHRFPDRRCSPAEAGMTLQISGLAGIPRRDSGPS